MEQFLHAVESRRNNLIYNVEQLVKAMPLLLKLYQPNY